MTHHSLYDPDAINRPHVVNGFLSDRKYFRCSVCVSDTTVPGISFDGENICNFCALHNKLDRSFPNNEEGKRILEKYFERIREKNKSHKYDCIVGISGGRDSCYLLYCAVKLWKLRPLAVHFNDGFDNPVAGENIIKATRYLGVDLRTITSDWNVSRDFKISELKASNPLLNSGTDVGIGGSLYFVAAQEKINTILFGQSFRTEGIKPISWAYIDGDYLKEVHAQFGELPFPTKENHGACFKLGHFDLIRYTLKNRIQVFAPLYYSNYIRSEADSLMKECFDWIYPGAHYFDDLYWALIVYIHRTKFNVDFRLNSYSALIRCGQMSRREALELIHEKYVIENQEILSLCVERLGLNWKQFEEFMARPPTRFYEISQSYRRLKGYKLPLKLASLLGFFPSVVYDKYYNCGA